MPTDASCHSTGGKPSKRSRAGKGRRRRESGSNFLLRVAVFGILAAAVVGLVIWQLWPQDAPAAADQTVNVSMAGFQPATVRVPAGRATTLRLDNTDSPFHTDGGGVHQFAVPELGIDLRINSESSAIATIPAATPGNYTFYCDTCCGGKENPAMRGTLVVS